ncbi:MULTISPECIES: RNA 2',3'-cyclic phosphodiesterase [Streptomyces]|uniref:RNA 2',3'-cyclic phosphodiesterase n=1 Tax=Streptomyces dengpaensis TaxID=2049881 RepID=A0ABM6STN3_9ACTN|nr:MULTISPECIES: RNA 2',3'-cyclic phosphodiesterase [Streptomyces]AVH58064.1 RNA 2',3'-cyclic phosphodiesterase [Streptomyces dengpaensis]PIB06445.1 2'-5' RNA ligase [Streptomyces sp. HG99]
MRLFAAVLPPEGVIRELASEINELERLPGSERLRWTGRPGWHFTLAFYGEVDDEIVPELQERLARAAHRTEPFPLSLHGGGHFGGRALWVGAVGGTETMRLLADRAEAAARKAGVDMGEHRRYRAHLTVARSRGDADFRPHVTTLHAFAGQEWTVRELCLVRSNLPTSGVRGERPRYETIASWPLGAAAGPEEAAG